MRSTHSACERRRLAASDACCVAARWRSCSSRFAWSRNCDSRCACVRSCVLALGFAAQRRRRALLPLALLGGALLLEPSSLPRLSAAPASAVPCAAPPPSPFAARCRQHAYPASRRAPGGGFGNRLRLRGRLGSGLGLRLRFRFGLGFGFGVGGGSTFGGASATGAFVGGAYSSAVTGCGARFVHDTEKISTPRKTRLTTTASASASTGRAAAVAAGDARWEPSARRTREQTDLAHAVCAAGGRGSRSHPRSASFRLLDHDRLILSPLLVEHARHELVLGDADRGRFGRLVLERERLCSHQAPR